MSTSGSTPGRSVDWRAARERGIRTLSAVTVAAVSLAVIIGGVGGRLAMALLAATNPDNDGAISDDGFVIGRFSLGGSIQLLGFSAQLGLVATVCYVALRGLLVGPRWFQVSSLAGGAGVVVGAMLVHTDGIDFTAFDPPALPIVLFVAIPVIYVAALALLAERLMNAAWFLTADRRLLAGIIAALWALGALLLPVLLVVVAVWAVWQLVRPTVVGTVVRSAIVGWVARALLAVMFAAAAMKLLSDVQTLT